MDTNYFFWFLAICASVFVGLGKGGLPVVAGLAVPSLSLIMSPIAAASLLLPVYIVSDIFALKAYRRDYDREVLKIGLIGMTIGVLIGWATAHIVIEWVITICIGVMGALFAFSNMRADKVRRSYKKQINTTKGYFWTVVAGFTSFISHNGGPPWQIYTLPLSLSKAVFVGTSVIAFSYCNAIKLVPYFFLDQINLFNIKITLYLMLPAAIAVAIGVKAVKLIPETLFFRIVNWALLIISVKLIYDGVMMAFQLHYEIV